MAGAIRAKRAARLPSTPVIAAHFLAEPPKETSPSWLLVPDGRATDQGLVVDTHGAILNSRALDQDHFLRNHHHAHAASLVAVANEHAFPRPPAWACRYLNTRLGGPAVGGSERLYVSRCDAGSRCVLNEQAVMGLLETFGFRSVTLSSMSLDQQIAAFQSCEIVIGAHGAGLSNTVFCRPGTKVVELSAPQYVFGCWFDLAQKCGLDYFLVRSIGIDLERWHGWTHQDDNFHVDLDDLRSVLARALDSSVERPL